MDVIPYTKNINKTNQMQKYLKPSEKKDFGKMGFIAAEQAEGEKEELTQL